MPNDATTERRDRPRTPRAAGTRCMISQLPIAPKLDRRPRALLAVPEVPDGGRQLARARRRSAARVGRTESAICSGERPRRFSRSVAARGRLRSSPGAKSDRHSHLAACAQHPSVTAAQDRPRSPVRAALHHPATPIPAIPQPRHPPSTQPSSFVNVLLTAPATGFRLFRRRLGKRRERSCAEAPTANPPTATGTPKRTPGCTGPGSQVPGQRGVGMVTVFLRPQACSRPAGPRPPRLPGASPPAAWCRGT